MAFPAECIPTWKITILIKGDVRWQGMQRKVRGVESHILEEGLIGKIRGMLF